MKSICPKGLGGSSQNPNPGHTHSTPQKTKEIDVRRASHRLFLLFWEGRCLVARMCGFNPQAVLAATVSFSLVGRHSRGIGGACWSLAQSLVSVCGGQSQVGPGDFPL